MNTAKKYHDSEGNECSIFQVVRLEPEWTASVIQNYEKTTAQKQNRIEELEGAIAAHNNECDFLCDNDKHCDHRPRQCASCPKDWKISI